jgi:hypothetical protein
MKEVLNLKKIQLSFFLIAVYFVFLIVFDFLNQKISIQTWPFWKLSIYQIAKNTVFLSLVWLALKPLFLSSKGWVYYFLISISFAALPYFLNRPLFAADPENLLLKASFLGFGFSSIIFPQPQKKLKLFFIPLFFSFSVLVPWELANGFLPNFSLFFPLFKVEWHQMVVSNFVVIDWVLAFVKTLFFIFQILVFQSIYKYENETLSPSKSHFIFLFLVLKTLIYWLLSILLIVSMGQNFLPFFVNKASLLLNMTACIFMVLILMIYLRNLTINFINKNSIPFYLQIMLSLPILEFFGLFILWFFNSYKFNKLPKSSILGILSAFLLTYSILNYFSEVSKLPASETELYRGLLIVKVLAPALAAFFFYFNFKFKETILFLTFAFFVPISYFYLVPLLEKSNQLLLISNNLYFVLLTLLFLIISLPFKEDSYKLD